MGYYITTDGRNGVSLFLIDRSTNKKQWWTTSLYNAIQFTSRLAAEEQCDKLRYKNPRVIDGAEAAELESENDHVQAINEVHPFSSEALGQD